MTPQVLSIGIDFGTSKCTVAWYNPQTGKAEILRNEEGEEKTPSLVYFGEDGLVEVGTGAEHHLQDGTEQERTRVVASVKRELGRNRRWSVPSHPGPVEVATQIFGKLKKDAEELRFHYTQLKRVVITYPATFRANEQQRIVEAATKAGFEEVKLLPEPEAAALAYTREGFGVRGTILVYDLGAGTFDLAVLRRNEQSGRYELAMKPEGIQQLGGDDFDRSLYDYCNQQALSQLNCSVSATGELNLSFLMECRRRKHNLSKMEQQVFSSMLSGPQGSQQFKHSITRAIFEDLIREQVEKTLRLTEKVVSNAREQGLNIESIVLIGGSARVPLVKQRLEQTLPGVEILKWDNADFAVALGAAYYASTLWRVALSPDIPGSHLQPNSSLTQENQSAFTIGSTSSPAPTQQETEVINKPKNILPTVSVEQQRRAEKALNRGKAFVRKKQLDLAINEFNLAIQLNPAFPESYIARAKVFTDLKEFDLVIKDYEQAIRINSSTIEPYLSRAQIFLTLQNYQGAIKDYNQAIEINPGIAAVFNDRGNLYLKLKDYNRAVQDFDRAIQLSPKSGQYYYHRSKAYEGKGNAEEANRDLKHATTLGNNKAKKEYQASIDAKKIADKQQIRQKAREIREQLGIRPLSWVKSIRFPILILLMLLALGAAVGEIALSVNNGISNAQALLRAVMKGSSVLSVTGLLIYIMLQLKTLKNRLILGVLALFGLGAGLIEAFNIARFNELNISPLLYVGLQTMIALAMMAGLVIYPATLKTKNFFRKIVVALITGSAIVYVNGLSIFAIYNPYSRLVFFAAEVVIEVVIIIWVSVSFIFYPGLLSNQTKNVVILIILASFILTGVMTLVSQSRGYQLVQLTYSNRSTYYDNGMTWSSDGTLLASYNTDSSNKDSPYPIATIYKANGSLVTYLAGHTDYLTSLAWSRDNKLVATGSKDKNVRIWTLDSQSRFTFSKHTAPVTAVAFSSDGRMLASGSCITNSGDYCTLSEIRLWDTLTGKEASQPLFYPGLSVEALAFNPDGKILASASCPSENSYGCYKPIIRLWNILTGKIVVELPTENDHITSLSFSPDNKLLVAASSDSIRLWTTSGQLVRVISSSNFYAHKTLAWSSDSKFLATAEQYGLVRLWNSSGDSIGTLVGSDTQVVSVAWLDNNHFISIDAKGITATWKIPD